MSTFLTPNSFFFTGKYGWTKYTVQLLTNENPKRVGRGGAWSLGIDRFFQAPLSYFCWVRGGHQFLERAREYHYDSSETAHCYCTRCNMWVPF